MPGIRVAVVEDEDELRELIVDDLHHRGCGAEGFASAEALYRHMSVSPVDIVVLDIVLPGENGYAVAAHLRRLASVGIIILTARGGRRAMAQGLAEGADLFLIKPVDYELLATAIANLHRRLASGGKSATANDARAGWSLAESGWTLRGPAVDSLRLSAAERAVLVLLFERRGVPVPRTALIQALTDAPRDFDPHRLDALIHRLRSRVKQVFGQSLPLRAVRGTGYVLIS